jgi:Family of unknown function (DUF5906)
MNSLATLDQAKRYLERVLPWPPEQQGKPTAFANVHYTFVPENHDPNKPLPWSGRACRTLEEAVRAVKWAAGATNVRDIYLCLSTQREPLRERTDGLGRKFYLPRRSRENAFQIKALYIDVDFKGGEHGYDTQSEAVKDLARFLGETKLPKPTLVVQSGGGLHVYWTLSRALELNEWQPLAYALAEATKQHKLKCDTQCTVDGARVLRIAGTFNRKLGQPRPVTLGGDSQLDHTPEAMAKALESYKTRAPEPVTPQVISIPPPSPSVLAKFAGLENDLSAGIDSSFPPIKLTDIATECAFVGDAIATGGAAYTEPMWNLTTLIATFTEGGRADAHLMGSGHPGYTNESTDERYDRKVREKTEKSLGWPSCSAIRTAGCTACEKCPHFNKGKTPLHFARPTTALVSETPANDNSPDPLRFISLPVNEAVRRINTEFFVLRSSGKIYRQDDDGEINAVPKHDFKTALGGRWVTFDKNAEVTRRAAADAWLDDAERREYRGFRYSPNNIGLRSDHLNLWTGWGDVISVEGDCSIVVEHILNIVADGDQAKWDFFLDWVADILQNPTRKPGVAPVLRGGQGSGKSVVPAIVRTVIGPKNVLTVNDKERMLSRFNSAVMNKILLVGEEMLFAGDRATTDKLKHLVTGQTLPVEFKFGDALEIESYHRLLLTSNHEQVIQAAGEERRFVIYDVSDAQRGDVDYFDKLYAVADGRDNRTASAFKYFLLHRNLEKFRPWQEQQCFASDAALTRQKQLSLSAPLAWLQEVMDTVVGQGNPGDYDWIDGLPYQGTQYSPSRESKWPPRFPRSQAVAAFRAWATKAKPFGASEFTGSPERFWADVCKVIPRPQTNRQTSNGVRTVCIDLADLQNNFQRYLRGEIV